MRVRRGIAVLGIALTVGVALATAAGAATFTAGEFNSGVVVAQDCPPEKCGK